MPTDVNNNGDSTSSDDGFSWNETLNSDGTDAEEEDDSGEDTTDENVQYNDPAKNRKLSEVTIAEQIREMFNLTIIMPRIFKGIHTNQFFFMDVSDDFYDANYPTIVEAIANKKYARYAGFQKGRFFIEKIKESGGVDGWKTELTLNPLPPSLAIWSKMQQEATKALIDAINKESGEGGGGGLSTTNGNDCEGGAMQTNGLSKDSYDINECGGNTIIGNSSANYATDTADMSAKEAILNIAGRYHWLNYPDNRTCPQEMWNKDGTIEGNCADISRLVKCVGEVHGLKVGIRHCPNHYYNLIEVDGTTYKFDCCFQSSGYTGARYGGELCNNLTMNGGPWSK